MLVALEGGALDGRERHAAHDDAHLDARRLGPLVGDAAEDVHVAARRGGGGVETWRGARREGPSAENAIAARDDLIVNSAASTEKRAPFGNTDAKLVDEADGLLSATLATPSRASGPHPRPRPASSFV